MKASCHRHDISDALWKQPEPHLFGRKGTHGGNAKDNRLFTNAVFWILRAGAPWRGLPESYGGWKNTHRYAHGAKGGSQDIGASKGGGLPTYILR
jgi:transposase